MLHKNITEMKALQGVKKPKQIKPKKAKKFKIGGVK